MMYGHVDHPRHWVGHLRVLAGIQDETGGFTEFVPLPFVHTSAPIYLAGVARPGPDPARQPRRARDGADPAARPDRQHPDSWVKLGVDGTRAMLHAGANDLGGTLMEETISRMAGSEHGSAKTVAELDRDRAPASAGRSASAPRRTASRSAPEGGPHGPAAGDAARPPGTAEPTRARGRTGGLGVRGPGVGAGCC